MISGRGGKDLQWTKLAGVLMVAIAVWLACDPDYPVPRDQLHAGAGSDAHRNAASRAHTRSTLRPEPLEPKGAVARAGLTFRWHWSGGSTDWRVVVLDDALEQIVEFCGTSTNSTTLGDDSLALLPPRLVGHWLVEARHGGQVLRSLPVPFALLD